MLTSGADLAVEDLADAYDYFWQTVLFVARAETVRPESFVEVSAADREHAANHLSAGRAALSRAEFIAAAGHFLAALSCDPFDHALP